jgi:hypothetical protein
VFFPYLFIGFTHLHIQTGLPMKHSDDVIRRSALFLVIFLFISSLLNAKENEKMIKVFDRFGNEIGPDPDFSNAHFATNPTVQAGYYELTFEDVQYGMGTGFDDPTNGAARRDVAVQVFTDLSQLIIPADHPYTGASNMNQPLVKIKIASWITINPTPPASALGVASAYYDAIQGSWSGLADGEVFKAINGGINPWANLANVGMYPSTAYHGYLAINLTNYPFSTNLSNPTAAGEYDLYSVMLHESFHMLGFGSLISASGSSTINGYYFYSRYDFFLHTSTGTPLVNITDGCYGVSFTGPATILTPPAGCANTITFNGTLTHPVYSPTTFASGSSLSHFEDACPPNIGYLMTYASGTGSAYMNRKPTTQEVSVLCDIGYQTTSTFGTPFLVSNGSLANTYSYDNTFSACGERVGGVNDFYSFTNQYSYYSGVGGVPTTYTDFLQNDENADHYTCLDIAYGGGTLSGLTPTTFTYTPDITFAAQAAILRYIPVSASGKKGNVTYMFINVVSPPLPTCASANCNLVCNGDFENVTNKYASPLGNFEMTQGSNSPDLFHNNLRVSDNASSSYMGCGSNSFPMPHGGLQYVGIVGGPNPVTINNSEGMNFPLSSPMVAGTTYQISFWARNHTISCPTNVFLVASPLAPCPMPIMTNVAPATTYCGYTYTPYAITSFLMNNVTSWTQFTYTYTPTVTCNYFMIYANGGGFFSYVFIDDIEIHKTPMDVFAGADTTICTGDAATLNGNACLDPSLNYLWSNSSGPVGSTPVLSVTPLATTTYTLTVTDPNTGISGTDVMTVTVQNCSTGINENETAGLGIYPNPSGGAFTIYLPEETKGNEINIKITNLLGEIVFENKTSQQTIQFDLAGKPKGIYLVYVQSENKKYTGKIILH